MITASFGLTCIGFMLLSLSLRRHYEQVWPASGAYRRWCLVNRSAGYACIAVAFIPCVLALGWWIGLVLWISLWAAAAMLQALLLTWWPRYSLVFGGGSVVLVLLGLWL